MFGEIEQLTRQIEQYETRARFVGGFFAFPE